MTEDTSAEIGSNSRPHSVRESQSLRAPCVTLALALCVGIVLDRYAYFVPAALWNTAIVGATAWAIAFGRKNYRLSSAALLVTVGALGALHHHRHWFERSDNDVSRLLHPGKQLLRIRGRVIGFPTSILRESRGRPFEQAPLTQFVVELEAVKTTTGWTPQTGRLRVDVASKLELAPNDQVEVFGWAYRFRAPANPGEPDYRLGQQAMEVRGFMRPANQRLVKVKYNERTWYNQFRLSLREKCRTSLQAHLKGDSLATALAFLIGDRSLLSTEVRNAFIETGTMHVLAISGVHVTVLGMFVATLCRSMRFGCRLVVVVVLAIAAMYLAIADVRPPMTRAFVLIVVWAVEQWMCRRSMTFNGLSIAALVILLLNPPDLFDVGAQLSFLAVGTMIWWARIEQRIPILVMPSRDDLPMSIARRFGRSLWKMALRSFVLSIVIWLVTTPLVATVFHVISPIGPVVNAPLAIVASPALWVGCMFLMASVLHPELATWFGWTLDLLMKAMLWLVRLGANIDYGHWYVPSPPDWWLFVVYGAIAVLMLVWLVRRRSRWLLAATVCWCLFGASLASRPTPAAELRCTFLSVGHGCAVLLESPQGHVLVYDIGCIGSGEIAQRAVTHALWHRRHRHIDWLFVSHADADHFNGVAGVLQTIPVKRFLSSPAFLRSHQWDARECLRTARRLGLNVETVTAGDQFAFDEGVELRVLHPESEQSYRSDNSSSVVLEVTYAGRRLLLTGDLEDDGLHQLLSQPARSIDVLMAPHHGSLNDNPPELGQWARPRYVVASAGRNVSLTKLRQQYGDDARVMATTNSGAISVVISATGSLRVEPHEPR